MEVFKTVSVVLKFMLFPKSKTIKAMTITEMKNPRPK